MPDRYLSVEYRAPHMPSRPRTIHANRPVSYEEITNKPHERTTQKRKRCTAKGNDYSIVELVPRQCAPAGLLFSATLTSVYL